MEQRRPLIGARSAQMAAWLSPDPSAKIRGKQLATWVYRKNASSFDEMTDLPLELRSRLAGGFSINPLQVASQLRSSDGVLKLLVHSGDLQSFECVLLPFEDRVSCCLSTQVGCAMGCEFCATGQSGFDRNLTAGEIVAQYMLLQKLTVRRISHVVYMGMGEPLHNYEAVVESLRLFKEEVGLSYRRLTVSTVGLAPQIERLAQERLPINLAVSLHSPLDNVRGALMPVNQRWNVERLFDACRSYAEATRRKLTFEYLLLEGITDSHEQAAELARLVKGLPCLVNLIPFNFVATKSGFKRPSQARVRAFRQSLEKLGVNVSQRVERGHEIAAACGQLRGQHEGRFAARRNLSELSVFS